MKDQIKDIFKKTWNKENAVAWIIAIAWSLLYWHGYRIIPGYNKISETMPIWLSLIGSIIFIISFLMLVIKNENSPLVFLLIMVFLLLSINILDMSYKKYPFISVGTIIVALLLVFILKNIKRDIKNG